jgi:hypothetical protein
MDFIFADDAQQKQASRPGMGSLVAVGGICVPGEAVGKLEGETVKGLLAKKGDRIGGVGLKLHPYFMYANLYHWLVGDTHLWMNSTAFPLPLACYPYSSHPNTFSSWP